MRVTRKVLVRPWSASRRFSNRYAESRGQPALVTDDATASRQRDTCARLSRVPGMNAAKGSPRKKRKKESPTALKERRRDGITRWYLECRGRRLMETFQEGREKAWEAAVVKAADAGRRVGYVCDNAFRETCRRMFLN